MSVSRYQCHGVSVTVSVCRCQWAGRGNDRWNGGTRGSVVHDGVKESHVGGGVAGLPRIWKTGIDLAKTKRALDQLMQSLGTKRPHTQ